MLTIDRNAPHKPVTRRASTSARTGSVHPNGAPAAGAGGPRPVPTLPRARVLEPAHVVPAPMDQAELWDQHFAAVYGNHPLAKKIWHRSGVQNRHGVVNPAVEDISTWSTGQRMQRYVAEALPLGIAAVEAALDKAGLAAHEVGLFSVVSCTGYATPGLDIRISEHLGMPADVQRLVVGHMGCYAAIPGLGAVSDFVVARGRPAVLLCIELTSLHPQPVNPRVLAGAPTTEDVEQLVAHALFADAASAVVVVPAGHRLAGPSATGNGSPVEPSLEPGLASVVGAGLEVLDVAAQTDWSTKDLMCWDVTDLGFRMSLSAKVPDVLAEHVGGVVDGLLARNGFTRDDVAGWAVHPGGRRILEVVDEQLGLPAGALDASYAVLRDYGNCSSPTVLLVLQRLLATTPLPSGAPVVALAFGPGLTLYAALLRRP